MGELLLGIVCGIALSLFFSFGPAFFSQIRTSIQYGYRKSYPFAFGVSAGDVIIVFLMLTVLKNVNLYELLHNVWVASIGGAVLVAMGFYYLRKEVTGFEKQGSRIKFKSKDGDPRRRTIFMQGFVINIVNPLIWIYWVSVDYYRQSAEHNQQGLCRDHVCLRSVYGYFYGFVSNQSQSKGT